MTTQTGTIERDMLGMAGGHAFASRIERWREEKPGLVNWLANAWRRFRYYHNTVRELSRLSDRDLADIGLRRCDIEMTARTCVKRMAASASH